MWTGLQVETGPTTPLPDEKLLVFILDRLQKFVLLASLAFFLFFLLLFWIKISIGFSFCV